MFLQLAVLNPILTPVSALSYYLLEGRNFELVVFFLSIFATLTNIGFKHLAPHIISNPDILLRPCDNSKTCACGILNPSVDPSDTLGMPSGHSQDVTAVVTFLILWLLFQPTSWRTYAVPPLLVVWAGWVMYTRHLLNCHTGLQILVGSFIGYLYGVVAYYLYHYYLADDDASTANTENTPMPVWEHVVLWAVIPVLYVFVLFALLYIE